MLALQKLKEYAATDRTRNTALKVFVRGRRWAMVRRNSREWRFF